jgi:hypothetical protein
MSRRSERVRKQTEIVNIAPEPVKSKKKKDKEPVVVVESDDEEEEEERYRNPKEVHDDDGHRINRLTKEERYPKGKNKDSGYLKSVKSHTYDPLTFKTRWVGYGDRYYYVEINSLIGNNVGWVYLSKHEFLLKVLSHKSDDEFQTQWLGYKPIVTAPRLALEYSDVGKAYLKKLDLIPPELDDDYEPIDEPPEEKKEPEQKEPEPPKPIGEVTMNQSVDTEEIELFPWPKTTNEFLTQMRYQMKMFKLTHTVKAVLRTKLDGAKSVPVGKPKMYTRTFPVSEKLGMGSMIQGLDLEWHNDTCSHISELTCISGDGARFFHRFVRYPSPLHYEWRKLIDAGIVTEAPEDNEYTPTLYHVAKELFTEFLPSGSVVISWGGNDGLRLFDAILDLPEKQATPLFNCWDAYGIRFIDGIVITKAFGEATGMNEFIKGGMNLKRVNEAMHYKSLVFQKSESNSLKGSFDILPKEIIEVIDSKISVLSQIDNVQTITALRTARQEEQEKIRFLNTKVWPKQCEFWFTRHLEPIYHTALTDTIVMRNVICQMLNWSKVSDSVLSAYAVFVGIQANLPALKEEKLNKTPYAAFSYFATHLQTKYVRFFRQANLTMSEADCLWIYNSDVVNFYSEDYNALRYRRDLTDWKKQRLKRRKDLEDEDESESDDEDTGFVPAKEKKLSGLLVGKDGTLCDPLIGKNKAIVNEMVRVIDKHMLGPPATNKYTHEHKPAFYLPAQISKKAPNTILLHCRCCRSLSEGEDRSRSRAEKTIDLVYVPDGVGLPKGYTVTYCKNCKRYEKDVGTREGRCLHDN